MMWLSADTWAGAILCHLSCLGSSPFMPIGKLACRTREREHCMGCCSWDHTTCSVVLGNIVLVLKYIDILGGMLSGGRGGREL